MLLLVNLQNKKNMKLVYLSGKIRAHLEDEMNMLSEFSKNKIPIRDMSSCIKGYK